jgi:hypothetical protein
MIHQVTLELPDSIFKPLAEIAAASGQTVADVAQSKLAEGLRADVPGQRLGKWAGAADSGHSDISTRHHDYLGEGHQCEPKA